MYVYADKLLAVLLHGGISRGLDQLQPCPCHPGTTPTLRVVDGHISTDFICSFSNCAFGRGDAVKLVAACSDCSMADAYALFTPKGSLYHTRRDTSESRQAEYSNGTSSQEIMRGYVGMCHAALETLEGCSIPGRWTELGCNAPTGRLPAYFGALVQDGMPPELRRLHANPRKDAYATHAYEYDGKITAISVRAASDPDKREVVRLHHEMIGVYPRPLLPAGCNRAFLAPSELATTAMRTFSSTVYTDENALPIFTSLGLPLPLDFYNVKYLYIVTYPGNQLSPLTALGYLGAEEIIEAAPRPAVSVMEFRQAPSIERVRDMHTSPPSSLGAVPLVVWIARQLKAAYLGQGLEAACQLLQQGPNLAKAKDDLLAALTDAEADDILHDAVRLHCDSPKSKAVLTNGNVVYASTYGYRGTESTEFNAKMLRLSNATLEVQEELLDASGTLWYRCQLHMQEHPVPIAVTLAHTDFEQGARLQRAVARELAEQNISCRAAFSSVPGFNWGEIRDAFKRTVRTVREVSAYGADELGDIHLPGLIVAEDGNRVEPQRRVISIPDDVSRQYGGIDYRTGSDEHLGPVVELWGASTPEAGALALGISHVLYCIVQDRLCKLAGVQAPLQHLCYVDPQPRTWRPTLEQLAALFSGVPAIGHLPGVAGRVYAAHFRQLSRLGSLPWIAELPESGAKTLQAFMRDASVNIIGMGDAAQGVALALIKNVAYVTHGTAECDAPGYLPARQLGRLRCALPELLRAVISSTAGKTVDEWTSPQLPAQAMFHGLADMFEQAGLLTARAPVDACIQATYVPYVRQPHWTPNEAPRKAARSVPRKLRIEVS